MDRRPFELLEHTADVGVIARGTDLPELFCNAARGMFSIICDTSAVQRKEEISIEARAENIEYLLFDWLDELLYAMSVKRILFSDFTVKVTDGVACGAAFGERIDASRHHLRLEIKAVTYHELKVAKRGDLWTATVIFDV